MKAVAAAFACALVCMGVESRAATIGPEQAAEMLAHAWMIDNRCNVLGNEDRDSLTNLVARAELTLAEKKGVAAARTAIGRGRASGTAAPCNSASADSVHRVLTAAKSATGLGQPIETSPVAVPSVKAREAGPETVAANETAGQAALEAAADGEAPAVEPLAEPMVADEQTQPLTKSAPAVSPRVRAKPAKVAIRHVPPIKKVAVKSVTVRTVKVTGYGQTAEAYYRELRCRTKSMKAVNAMYAQVLRQHHQAVASSGKTAVRALLRAAQARASRGSC